MEGQITEDTVITLNPNGEEQETEQPAESPAEEEQETEEAPSHQGAEEESKTGDEPNTDDDNNVPLNKNPRFQEVIQQNREMREKLAQLEELQSKVSQLESRNTVEEKPDWFREAYGDDDNAWNVQKNVISKVAEQVKNELKQAELRQAQERQAQEARWNNYVSEELGKLEAEGKKFDKNELLKAALDYQPTDAQGNISLPKAYEILQMKKQMESQEKTAPKKAVAALSTAPSKQSQPKERDYMTPSDLRGKSFRDLI